MGTELENTQVGPFFIERRLGTRRQQQVFRARQIEQNRSVAVKFIALPPHRDRERALAKLQAEFALLRELRHPHLVRNYGAGIHGDKVFFAMELVEGESLARFLARRGRLSIDLVVDLARQIAEGLEYIHGQGLLHLKLTPEKVLLGPDFAVKIADLRYHRRKKKSWRHRIQRDLELIAYLAPEHIAGEPSERSDLYSLGVMMFELLTGQLPCPPEALTRMVKQKNQVAPPRVGELVLNCPVWVEQLVTQLLHADPKRRPHSARAVRGILEEIQQVDEQGEAAVAKLAGGFTPLTAAADRDAARLMLAQSAAPSTRVERRWAWLWVGIAAGLLVLAVLYGWSRRADTVTRAMARATAWVASPHPEDWRRARTLLADLQNRHAADEVVAADIRALRHSAQLKLLLHAVAQDQISPLHSDSERRFIEANRLERQQAFDRALAMYRDVAEQARSHEADAFLRPELQQRITELTRLMELPRDRLALVTLIDEARGSAAGPAARRESAMDDLDRIVRRFATAPELADVVESARQVKRELQQVKESLEQEEPVRATR